MTTVRTAAKRTKREYTDTPDSAETASAFRRISALDEGPERERLRQEVVVAWMPMARRLARRFRNRGEAVEDLQQVASLGLIKAVARYDPHYGAAFASFAVPTVVGEIKRHFRDHMWDVHVPRRVQELRNRVRGIRHALLMDLGRSPTAGEVAEHGRMSREDVLTGTEALNTFNSLSLDMELPGAEDGYCLADTLSTTEPRFDGVVDRESLKPRLRKLPERERRILYLRFFCDMTQQRIGEQFGISQMHVSRILTRTCDRLNREIWAEVDHEDHSRSGTDWPGAAPELPCK
jgi:RNA polymerase sigma-70 factor (sigma-B/F/G subfamily)